MYFNLDKWNALPPAYQAALESAAADANTWMQAKYDAQNPAALRRLVADGAQLRPVLAGDHAGGVQGVVQGV